MLPVQRRGLLLSAAIKTILGASAYSMLASAAIAQEATPTTTALDEVVVTGFRGSLEAALDVKRDQVGAVDAIIAEDIADFPDLNLAESIQRIPGVAIARDAGEGRTITVRGLGPEFTRVRLNGMEAMSANGGTDSAGGTNRARRFDFNTFASELFNSITVRKTSSADVEEGSLGATVDLRVARPFDYKGLTLVGSVNAAYNSLAEETDPRVAALYSQTFADEQFGILFSAAYTRRHLIDEGSSTVRWARPSGTIALAPGYVGAPTGAQINAAFVPRIPRYDYYEHDQDRLGLTASFQWRPADATLISVDALYARFDANRSEIFLEVPNFSSAANGMQATDAVIDSTNSVVYGAFNNVDIRSENRHDELSTIFQQFTIDGSHEFTDKLKLTGLVGYSESEHDNPIQTTLLFDWNNAASYSYDFRNNNRLPVVNFGSTNLVSTANGTPQTGATSTVNSNGWYLSQIRLRPQTSFNSFTNYSVNLEWQMTDTFALQGGVQLKDFVFETTEKRRSNGTTANQEAVISASARAQPIASYSTVFTFPSSIGLPAGSNGTFLIPDLNVAPGILGIYDPTLYPVGIESALANNFDVSETDTGGFAQLDMDTELFGMRLRGNLGVRFVQTKQTSTGYTFVSGSPYQVTADRTYDDTLPSLNLALDVLPDLVIRLGAAKVMSRPGLGALAPGGTVNVSGNNRVASLGNPNTDPTRANAYDLSAEWYFADQSLLSLAVFRKDIDSRPQALTLNNQVFSDNPFGIPDSVAIAACGTIPNCAPELPIWTFNTTINGPGGKLQGYEASYQQPFFFLPIWLSNFGAILNYTHVKSDITYINPITGGNDITDLTGLSENSANATLYYETDKFGARVSAAYRSGYLDQVPGRDGNNLEGTNATTTIDASIKYTINDHFEVTLEALNLSDEYQDQWVDQAADRLSYYHHTGRNFILGVRGKL